MYLDRDTYFPERMSCRSCSTNRYLCVGEDGQEVTHTGQEYNQLVYRRLFLVSET